MPVATVLSRAETARLRTVVLRLGRLLRRRGISGLTPSQMSALSVIERHEPISLGELGRIERLGKSSVTRLIANLEELGLLSRQTSADDRRSIVVALTADGRSLLAETSRRADAFLSERLEELSPDERNTVVAALPLLERLVVITKP